MSVEGEQPGGADLRALGKDVAAGGCQAQVPSGGACGAVAEIQAGAAQAGIARGQCLACGLQCVGGGQAECACVGELAV